MRDRNKTTENEQPIINPANVEEYVIEKVSILLSWCNS